MKKLMTVLALVLPMIALSAHAADDKKMTSQQNKMGTCNAQAKDKSLKGDERKAFMKECLSAQKSANTAQKEKMKTCNADAKTKKLKGDERKAFMKDCLSKG